ncbi:FkbM family methyltransferase [Nocardioides sp.]|uniref:FkbM family methyltransferase n=1 Tax=Nocardioides sp. TaxID=35761 RepID=UPI00271990C1|nr:FkbM family methyltransferase [Nocardioides sp.]MDO9456159.1 FkbM family methyltransferase [Nocardioides sp.]
MSPLRTTKPDELLAAVAPLVDGVRAPVDAHRSWVFQGRVVVLDYLVHGAPVGFDVLPGERRGSWRIEVIARNPVDGPLVARLGLERVAPRKFLVAELPAGDRDALPRAVADHCLGVLDELAAGGPTEPSQRLLDALALTDPVVVVDVGANPLELPAYTRLLGMGVARVVGFEPQPEAFAELQGRDPARELFFPHAIGSPGPGTLNVYNGSGFASTFDIDDTSIDLIGNERWHEGTRLRGTIPLELTALDDVPDLPALDLLKIDVQGGELAVFSFGRRALSTALCVIPEVAFFPLYRDAPSFADVHQELVAQGFQLHKFMFQKSVHLHGSQTATDRIRDSRSQLVDGDAVYLRDLRGLASWADDEVKKLVLLATYVFDSPDLAVRALDELVRRGQVPAGLPASYAAARYV